MMRVECVGGCGQSVVVKLPDEIDELEEYDSDKIEGRREVRTFKTKDSKLQLAEPG